jgi:hypothetical protein
MSIHFVYSSFYEHQWASEQSEVSARTDRMLNFSWIVMNKWITMKCSVCCTPALAHIQIHNVALNRVFLSFFQVIMSLQSFCDGQYVTSLRWVTTYARTGHAIFDLCLKSADLSPRVRNVFTRTLHPRFWIDRSPNSWTAFCVSNIQARSFVSSPTSRSAKLLPKRMIHRSPLASRGVGYQSSVNALVQIVSVSLVILCELWQCLNHVWCEKCSVKTHESCIPFIRRLKSRQQWTALPPLLPSAFLRYLQHLPNRPRFTCDLVSARSPFRMPTAFP